MNIENAKTYLKELMEFCIKHDTFISGCGCCDSPFAMNGKGEYTYKNINVEVDGENIIAFMDINVDDAWVTLKYDGENFTANKKWY